MTNLSFPPSPELRVSTVWPDRDMFRSAADACREALTKAGLL